MTRLALLLACVAWTAAQAQPVFTGDPIDSSTGDPYVMLPGVPLIHPGDDEKYGTQDDRFDPMLVGDVDLVVRTRGGYAGGPIPPPHASVAAAPAVVAGGAATGTGSQAVVQGIFSDGLPPALAGNPLTGPELDGRPLLVLAYADLDGDGVVGATSADGSADDQIERQEILVLAGRQTASFTAGVATASMALYVGAPASAGGLGVVVAAGATTGSTPFLYFDGPYVTTLLPYVPPLDPDRIIGSNGVGGPVPFELLTDFELEFDERTFAPAPDHPLVGTPFAIPLDGSSVTVDVLRVNGGAAAAVACGRPVDPATFVADPARRLVPAVGPGGTRTLYEGVDSIALASDGAGGAASVDCFVVDRLGNATDPPAGGFAATLEAGEGLRIVAPDADGDPRREPVVFANAAALTVQLDDAGAANPAPVVDRLLFVVAGSPVGALRVELGAGPGGPGGNAGTLGAGRTRLRFGRRPSQGRLEVQTLFAPAGAVDAGTAPVAVSVVAARGPVFARTVPAGAMRANGKGTKFRFREPRTAPSPRVERLVLRRMRSGAWSVRLRVHGVDLSGVPPSIPEVGVGVSVGASAFAAPHGCRANRPGTVTTCAR